MKNLPEKWCIKTDKIEVVQYCNKYGVNPPYILQRKEIHYAHFPNFNFCTTAKEIQKGYTEISFDEFKEHILNEKPKLQSYDYLISFFK